MYQFSFTFYTYISRRCCSTKISMPLYIYIYIYIHAGGTTWEYIIYIVLMQDNNPKHTSKLCQRNIKSREEQPVLQLMSWSADLNPIELVWDELNRKVRAKQPTGAAYLLQILQESWWVGNYLLFTSLMERTPRICEAVTAAKGGHFQHPTIYRSSRVLDNNQR